MGRPEMVRAPLHQKETAMANLTELVEEYKDWLDAEFEKHSLKNTMNDAELFLHSGFAGGYAKASAKLTELLAKLGS